MAEKGTELVDAAADEEERLDLEPERKEEGMCSKTSPANYINILVFLANVTVFYICEFSSAFGATIREKTKTHQTLLSVYHERNDDSFMIWHAIFAWELIFVVVQISPAYRQSDLVFRITPWWILVNTTQIAWTLALMLFVEDYLVVVAGLVMVNFTILIILIGRIETRGLRKPRFWLDPLPLFENWVIRVPFSIHAGYLMCMSMMYVNAILQQNPKNLVDNGEPSGVMVATSMTSITAILTLTAVFSMAVPRPDGFFCIGVGWYNYWTYRELQSGAAKFREIVPATSVSNEVVQAFEYSTATVAFLAGCMATLSFALRFVSALQKNRVQ